MDDTQGTQGDSPREPLFDEFDLWIIGRIIDLDADGRDELVAWLRENSEALADRAAVHAHRQNVFDMLDADPDELRRMRMTPSRLAALEESRDANSPLVRRARWLAGRAGEVVGDFDAPLESGDTVGAYLIASEIGRGGAGVVYFAVRDDIGLEVALKLLSNPFSRHLPGDTDDERSERARERERFLSEQRALAKLHHPGIAQVYDAGETADGRPYVAMELVEGVPVTEYARHIGVRGRVRLFRQLCDAVSHVHARGFAHGDLKPANVIVREDDAGRPVVKVVDFGVATPLHSAKEQPGSTAGPPPLTLAYASPERRDGAQPSVASDVYSLGVVLGEMFSTLADTLQERGVPGAPRVPLSPIAAVARRASSVDPRHRYDDVEALMRDLQEAAQDAVLASLPVAHAGPSSPPRFPGEPAREPVSRRYALELEQDRQNAARRATALAWTDAFLLVLTVVVAAALVALVATN